MEPSFLLGSMVNGREISNITTKQQLQFLQPLRTDQTKLFSEIPRGHETFGVQSNVNKMTRLSIESQNRGNSPYIEYYASETKNVSVNFYMVT